jgi:predicted transport protein
MALFKNSEGKFTRLKENPFKLEKDIQSATEKNLETIFNLKKIKSEFSVGGFRIDTLAHDPETNALVIIEYKKDENFTVIDQGFAYLALLLNNKADFVLEYANQIGKPLNVNSVDWSQSRVLFVSPGFTKFQQQAINFRDLPIELWEIKQFENNLILFNQLKAQEGGESITKIGKTNRIVQKVSREVKVYTEEEHVSYASETIKEMYEQVKSVILQFSSDITIQPKKMYIAFKSGTNFVDIEVQKKALKCHLNLSKGKLEDPQKIARDVSHIGHWGNGDYEVVLTKPEQIPYFLILAKQAYFENK